MTPSLNETLLTRAQKTIPAGVNSPVRAFYSVGGTPRFIKRAQGPYFWDADSKRYIDYLGSWGPMIAGHGNPEVISAIEAALANGLSFGAPTEAEVEMAETLCALMPSLEQVRLVSSGTEAVMSTLRLARAATGRARIVKFEGGYHGHVDSLLVKAGSGLSTFGHPTSAGVPDAIARDTIVLEYNNNAQLDELFSALGNEIAAVIVEPIAGNMNLVRSTPAFLSKVRELCTAHHALLIFDEVISGFRVALGGAQAGYGIKPDLTCLGKVIGGGLPLAAFGGRHELMQSLAPIGEVYQAGTLSGNPIAVAAGLATLGIIQQPGFYEKLEAQTARLTAGLVQAAHDANIPFSADHVGSLFGLYFAEKPPTHYAEVSNCDRTRFKTFFHTMLASGIHFAPSAFEAGFVSSAHDESVIDATVHAARVAFTALAA
jgi:glutamate-1-semialdehyde 2,1-aminomutase